MRELEMRMSKELGISADVAHKAVHMTVEYLKTRIPEPLWTNIDDILELGEHPEDKEEKAMAEYRIP